MTTQNDQDTVPMPMPDMRPWTFNDVPLGTFWLRVIDDTVGPRWWLVIFANETGLAIGGNRLIVPWSPTREDGSWWPCKKIAIICSKG